MGSTHSPVSYTHLDVYKRQGKEFDLPMNTVVKLYPNGTPSYTEDDIKAIQKTDPDFVYNPDDYKSVDLVIYDTINKDCLLYTSRCV